MPEATNNKVLSQHGICQVGIITSSVYPIPTPALNSAQAGTIIAKMFVSSRMAQLLRQKPVQESIFQAATRRTLVKQTPLRRNPSNISRTYFTARPKKSQPLRSWQSAYRDMLLRPFRGFRSYSSKNSPNLNPTPHLGSPEATGIKARLKKLSKEYGWVALGVYFGLSLLDFPFCFLAVRLAGPERIGQIEHTILTSVKSYTEPIWKMVEPIIGDWSKGKEAAKQVGDAIEDAGEQVEKRPATASKSMGVARC